MYGYYYDYPYQRVPQYYQQYMPPVQQPGALPSILGPYAPLIPTLTSIIPTPAPAPIFPPGYQTYGIPGGPGGVLYPKPPSVNLTPSQTWSKQQLEEHLKTIQQQQMQWLQYYAGADPFLFGGQKLQKQQELLQAEQQTKQLLNQLTSMRKIDLSSNAEKGGRLL